MPRFLITAQVTVSLAMTVEAESAKDAEAMFHDEIAMTASLVSSPPDKWDVEDDAIDLVENLQVESA